MFKKIFFLLIIFVALVVPAQAMEPANINAGFIPGPIWFSKFPFFVGDEIRIYTALYNNSEYDIEGKLEFRDGENIIAQKPFSLSRGSGARDIWTDWKAPKGKHQLSIIISEAIVSNAHGVLENYSFGSEIVAQKEVFVDADNDNDGIGNVDDEDDDNDGVSDIDEIKLGTDPFKVDHVLSTSTQAEQPEAKDKNYLDKNFEKTKKIITETTEKIEEKIPKQAFGVDLSTFDIFAKEQISALEAKKQELLTQKKQVQEQKFFQDKTGEDKQKNTASNTAITLPSITQKIKVDENDKQKTQQKINTGFSVFKNNLLLFFINILIFLFKHKLALFLTLLFFIYNILKILIRTFVD